MTTTVLFVIFMILLVTFAYGGIRGAPWVPTWKSDVDRFLKLANIKPGDKVYELGCGDGRITCAAAKAGANAVGYEVSLFPFSIALIRKFLSPHKKRTKLRYQDFWFKNLSDADVVYFFLMEKVYDKLKAKLEKELKPGTKVIAYVWPIPGWEPDVVDTMKDKPNLYVYTV